MREPRTYLRRGVLVSHLSADEDSFITARHAEGMPFKEIARRLSLKFHHRRTAHTVKCRLVALGVYTRRQTCVRLTGDERERILELAAQGLSSAQIGATIGKAPGTVWHVVRRARIQHRQRPTPGWTPPLRSSILDSWT